MSKGIWIIVAWQTGAFKEKEGRKKLRQEGNKRLVGKR